MEGKDIWLFGGASLTASLMNEDWSTNLALRLPYPAGSPSKKPDVFTFHHLISSLARRCLLSQFRFPCRFF